MARGGSADGHTAICLVLFACSPSPPRSPLHGLCPRPHRLHGWLHRGESDSDARNFTHGPSIHHSPLTCIARRKDILSAQGDNVGWILPPRGPFRTWVSLTVARRKAQPCPGRTGTCVPGTCVPGTCVLRTSEDGGSSTSGRHGMFQHWLHLLDFRQVDEDGSRQSFRGS
jgi:hypothetical protein